MKKIIFAIALSALAVTAAQSQTITVNKENRTIAVTATDSASAAADVASINIGFHIYAPDAQAAYANGSVISNAVVKALLDAGIDKKRIQSSDQQLAETYFNPNDKLDRVAQRFNLTQNWTVTTSAENAAKVLNIAVTSGANTSGHIEWSLADDNALEARAAAKAMQRANDIAASMAKGLGAKLGPLVYASNQTPNRYGALVEDLPVEGRGVGMGFGVGGGIMPLAITSKEIQKSATVYAVFSIE